MQTENNHPVDMLHEASRLVALVSHATRAPGVEEDGKIMEGLRYALLRVEGLVDAAAEGWERAGAIVEVRGAA